MSGGFINPHPFQALTPADLSTYLRSQQWREVFADDVKSLWKPPKNSRSNKTLLLPLRPAFEDYTVWVDLLFAGIAVVEGRSVKSIYRDVAFISYDMMSFALHIDFEQRVPPIEIKAGLLDSLTRLFTATAFLVLSKERDPKFDKLPADVLKYKDDLKIEMSADSERRIYFFYGPFAGFGRGKNRQTEAERSIFVRCKNALYALSQHASVSIKDISDDAFILVDAGVTYLFAEALIQLMDFAGDNGTITITYRSSILSPIPHAIDQEFRISQECKTILNSVKDAAEDLKDFHSEPETKAKPQFRPTVS